MEGVQNPFISKGC